MLFDDVVVHAFMVGGLEGIRAQVEELREPQRDEWLFPDLQAMGALFSEDDLPLVIAEAHERALVIEVEELVARARGVPGRASFRTGSAAAARIDASAVTLKMRCMV